MLPAVRLCSVVCGLALSCFAQGFRIGGPVAGFVFDAPSKSLRQVLGMPGAAHLSPALLADVDWASVAPNGRTVVVIRQGEARLVSTADVAQNPPGGPLEGLYEPPTLDPPIALDGVEGEVTALATDAASKIAVVAVAGAGVYRVTSEGVVLVLPMADVSAIAMSPGGDLLWVADRSNGQVLEVASPGSNPESRILLSDSERFADLSALALSSDNKRLYLASRSTRVLYWLDRSTSLLSEGIELDTPATLFSPLGRPSLLLLLGVRAKLGDPFYLLDEQSGPGLFFVPAGEGDQQ